jgi:hypothetical protein
VQAGTVAIYEGWHVVERFDRERAWTVAELREAMAGIPPGPPKFDVPS